jgi:hypothetical protein
MFVAHQNGELIEELAKRYGLEPGTVCQTLRIERHKVAVSVDEFYERIRSES